MYPRFGFNSTWVECHGYVIFVTQPDRPGYVEEWEADAFKRTLLNTIRLSGLNSILPYVIVFYDERLDHYLVCVKWGIDERHVPAVLNHLRKSVRIAYHQGEILCAPSSYA